MSYPAHQARRRLQPVKLESAAEHDEDQQHRRCRETAEAPWIRKCSNAMTRALSETNSGASTTSAGRTAVRKPGAVRRLVVTRLAGCPAGRWCLRGAGTSPGRRKSRAEPSVRDVDDDPRWAGKPEDPEARLSS